MMPETLPRLLAQDEVTPILSRRASTLEGLSVTLETWELLLTISFTVASMQGMNEY